MINQFVCKLWQVIIYKSVLLVFDKCFQCCGVCMCVYIIILKKLNLVFCKVVKVCLINQEEVISYIGGEGYNLQEYFVVFICGGCVKDLLGVCYYIVCGLLDVFGVVKCCQGCFKYGVKCLKS